MKLTASLLDMDADSYDPMKEKQSTSSRKRLLHAGDTLIAMFVIGPLVVLHWRGTWALMDRVPAHFSPAKSVAVAMLLLCTIAMMREFLFDQCSRKPAPGKLKHSRGERLARSLLRKVYAYGFGVGCNMQWRGSWALLDGLVGVNMQSAAYEIAICFALLVMLSSVRNLVAPPGIILTDSKDMSFRFPTRFRIKATDEPGLYILDCLFSVVVIGTLVVFVWRGVWTMCDLLLYPGDPAQSAWASMFIGYSIVAACFCLQSTMRWLCEQLSGLPRLAAADIFLAFSFVGTANVWRGVWNVCDVYFMPEHKLAGDIITHIVPFILLAMLNCSNSVLVRGVYIDAEEPAGQCVIFPVYYVRMFFQKERTKKQEREAQMDQLALAAAMAAAKGEQALQPLLSVAVGGGGAVEYQKPLPTIVIVPANHVATGTNGNGGGGGGGAAGAGVGGDGGGSGGNNNEE